MKPSILLFLITPAIAFSQSGNVGINTTTPSARLDIVSKGNANATLALKVNSNTNSPLMSVADNGNVYFKNELEAAGSPGVTNYVLTSSGDNVSPVYQTINNTVLGKWVVEASYRYNAVFSPFFTGYSPVSFPTTDPAYPDSTTVGTWDIAKQVYTVAKAGVFEVTLDVKTSTQNSYAARYSSMWLQIGTYRQGTLGVNVSGTSTQCHLTCKVSRYLTVGETISANADGSGNNLQPWQFNRTSININYSEKTN